MNPPLSLLPPLPDTEAPATKRGSPAEEFARSLLARYSPADHHLLRCVVGVTQLHARGGCSDAAFAVAGAHCGDLLFNVLARDEASIHFAAAVLHAAVSPTPSAAAIQAAATAAIQACVAALLNLVRASVDALPDCTGAGIGLLKSLAAHDGRAHCTATAPQPGSSSP